MANDLYRGYEIKPLTRLDGVSGFIWTDERDCDHFAGEPRVPFATADKAMDAIDAHIRARRAVEAA